MMKAGVFVVFALLLVCLCGLVVSLATYTVGFTVSTVGTVKSYGVAVYWDHGCTQNVMHVDWETLEPNQTKTFTVYVKSLSSDLANLSVVASNWTPETVSSFLVFEATPNNIEIEPTQVLDVALSLTVSPEIADIDSFGFDITFTV